MISLLLPGRKGCYLVVLKFNLWIFCLFVVVFVVVFYSSTANCRYCYYLQHLASTKTDHVWFIIPLKRRERKASYSLACHAVRTFKSLNQTKTAPKPTAITVSDILRWPTGYRWSITWCEYCWIIVGWAHRTF